MRWFLAVLVLFSISARADVQLADSFDGASIDTSKWNVLLPFSDSAVSLQNGFFKSLNRGTLSSVADFSKPYVISGTFRNNNDFSVFGLYLRSDGIRHSNDIYGGIGGIGVGFWGPANFYSPGKLTVTRVGFSGHLYNEPLAFEPNRIYDFSILDTGTSLTLHIDGNKIFELPTLHSAGAKIGFSGRESIAGNIGNSDLFQIQVAVIPEPSSLSLLLAGGALALARRRKS